MRLSPLPGSVPKTTTLNEAIERFGKPSDLVADQTETAKAKGVPAKIRPDFQRELEMRLEGWLGQPGTEKFDNLQKMVKPFLRDGTGEKTPINPDSKSRLNLDRLPEKTKHDLEKLQHAAEGMESIFVKKILAQMRSVSFDKEKSSGMSDFAKDMMDQTVAEQAAKGKSSIGIARMVFLDTAQTMVKGAIATPEAKD